MAGKVKIKDMKGGKGKEAAKVKGGVETDSILRGKAAGRVNPKTFPEPQIKGGGRNLPGLEW